MKVKNRSELREIIMKVIYQTLILKESNLEIDVDFLIKEQLEIDNEFVKTSVYGILEKQKTIEKQVNDSMKDWEIKRLNKVDQAILLL